jgi:APA family basic amino acid/polyamine antiporter
MLKKLFRKKSVQSIQALELDQEHHLKRTLSAFDLTCLGVGAIIGVGIFVVTGTAAARFAGPGIMLSFVLSMLACVFAALCYAEFASILPVAGSAYNYSYATLGEIFAWVVGWDLVLEYVVGCICVSIGWSGYFVNILKAIGINLPVWCTAAPGTVPGAIINLPAVLIILILTVLLVLGIKNSARFTTILVFIKVLAICIFLGVGFSHVNTANWTPFMPFGFKGIMTGAAIIFLAYIGFDAVSTAAEETKNPQRNLPIGILASLVICTVLYIVVAAVLTGLVPYTQLDNPAPVANALSSIGFKWSGALVSTGAITGITSVLIVLLIGQPRIFFAMSRDGLLWPWWSKVHPKYKTPYRTQILCGLVVAFFAAFVDIGTAAELTNIGTLFAFTLVCGGILVLRYTDPNLHRAFRAPFVPVTPILGMIICIALMFSLPTLTWIRFIVWFAVGIVIYSLYSRKHSALANGRMGTSKNS